MSRIPLVEVDRMTDAQRAQYDRFPSNLTRTLLLLDARLARALPETANALRASGLDAALREAVILRVAALTASAYERRQHLDQARGVGWSDREIAAIEADGRAVLSGDVAAVLAFVDVCVAGPHVDDAVFSAVRAVLSDRDLVTVVVLVGHYLAVARLTGILQVEPDARPDPFTREH